MTARPGTSATGLFLRRWLQAPAKVGAVAPSSKHLGLAMARAALHDKPWLRGQVVELGPGTGRITEALLDQGLPGEALLAIERDAALAGYLQAQFPHIGVLAGDAAHLRDLLGGAQVAAVVSSLPLLSLGHDVVGQIVASIADVLPKGCSLIQYTYGRNSPIPVELTVRHHLHGQRIGRVWRNLPPAAVWRFRKQ